MSNIAWPKELEHSRACRALETSWQQNRLGHALLLIADSPQIADEAARVLAAAHLGARLPHADYMSAEPTNKQRQIGVEAMREMREFLQKSSLTGKKVAHIGQAERLNVSAANLFLKILEEPPTGTLTVMTTHEPYAILPTILSRAMRFRLGKHGTAGAEHAQLSAWTKKLKSLIHSPQRQSVMMRMALVDEALQMILAHEDNAPRAADREDETPKEVLEAIEAGRQKAFKKELFSALEEVALESFKESPGQSMQLARAMTAVETAYRLTEFNLNTPAALESAVGGVIEALAPNV